MCTDLLFALGALGRWVCGWRTGITGLLPATWLTIMKLGHHGVYVTISTKLKRKLLSRESKLM